MKTFEQVTLARQGAEADFLAKVEEITEAAFKAAQKDYRLIEITLDYSFHPRALLKLQEMHFQVTDLGSPMNKDGKEDPTKRRLKVFGW